MRPTKAQLAAAHGGTIPDVLAPDLAVLFCGINPGLYSGALGLHFARPGNRFWPALHAAGFTDRLLHPSEDRLLVAHGYGITNIADPATAAADELTDEELRAGARRLATPLVGEAAPRAVPRDDRRRVTATAIVLAYHAIEAGPPAISLAPEVFA